MFYSHSSETIQQGYFDGLINNSGSFNIVKLSQTRKNALDYYIAIRVGEIIKEYPNEKILIVSKDKGYYAVLEYCESYSEISDKIKLAPSIGTGLVMLDGNTNRRKVIMNKRRTIQLETEYQIHQERVALYKRVASALLSTPYSEEAKKASHLIETKNTPKELYMSSLHEFGVRRGQEIYRLIKNI